jgi:hypothetical protein
LCLAVSGVIACSLIAVAGNQPVIGVLSLVEIGARDGAQNEGVGREVLPGGVNRRTADEHAFVEVVQVPRLREYQACRASGAKDCNTNPKYAHEWSAPYIPEQYSEKLEEGLSRAWNRFDARTLWRMNAYINSNPDPHEGPYSYGNDCNGSKKVDGFIDAWNDNPNGTIDPNQFCDDLKPDGQKAYECKDFGNYVKWIDWNVVQKRYDAVMKHSSEKYYNYAPGSSPADYWSDVYAMMDRWMPGALDWDGVYDIDRYGAGSGQSVPSGGYAVGTAGGSTLSPVFSLQPNPSIYQKLASRAQSIDPRGYDYVMQQYKGMGGNRKNLKAAPGDSYNPGYSGLPKFEVLKYDLSDPDRDIFNDPPARKWSVVGQARPTGSKGLGSMEEQQNVGHATFLRVWARKDREYSPREVHFIVKCKKQKLDFLISRKDTMGTNIVGSSDLKPGCCGPVTFDKTRAHTDWKSIPEGYQIPNVVGIPVNRDPTKSNGYVPPAK